MHMFWIHIWTNEYLTNHGFANMYEIHFFHCNKSYNHRHRDNVYSWVHFHIKTIQWLSDAVQCHNIMMWCRCPIVLSLHIFQLLRTRCSQGCSCGQIQTHIKVRHSVSIMSVTYIVMYPRRNVAISSYGYGTNIQYTYVVTHSVYFQTRIITVTALPCI